MSLCLANHILKAHRESDTVEFSNESAFNLTPDTKNKTKFPIITNGGPKIEDLTWLMK